MDTFASGLIDALGGTTAVARMTKNKLSTVHSCRRIGLNDARLDHFRLAAHEHGVGEIFDRFCAQHGRTDILEAVSSSPGKIDDLSPQVAA